ncbi:MAG: hypothetical protein Kow0092_39900 [Deferrisomatales bacterium]
MKDNGATPTGSRSSAVSPCPPARGKGAEAEIDGAFDCLKALGLEGASFAPWSQVVWPLRELLAADPLLDRLGSDNAGVQQWARCLRGQPSIQVIGLRDPEGRVQVFDGRYRARAWKELAGGDGAVEMTVGWNRSPHATADLYRYKKAFEVNKALYRLEKKLEEFADSLEDEQRAAEFAPLRSVLCRYVHYDLRSGAVNDGLMGLLIDNLAGEIDRLLASGVPFTQEVCGALAHTYEQVGNTFDDLYEVFGQPQDRGLALLGYELANLWYRAAQHVYPGLFPALAQLHIVKNMIRLGRLSANRSTFRRAIRELFVLLDTDRFADRFLALVGHPEAEEPLGAGDRDDFVRGFLDTRRKFRAEVREAMAEAVISFHRTLPEPARRAFRQLEQEILAGRKGPTDLLRALQGNLTVISELANVEGGWDFQVGKGPEAEYQTVLEHVQAVAEGLEALETASRGLAEAAEPSPSGRRRGRAHLRAGIRYFYNHLTEASRASLDFEGFIPLFVDVVEDYRSFTTQSPISKLNFWMGALLHDIGWILVDRHHVGGVRLARSLLEALELSPERQLSILSHILNHGEFKRFYLLEKSPRTLLSFIHRRKREGRLPLLLIERKRIESILDLAATGEGRLTVKFLRVTRAQKSLEAMERLVDHFAELRRSTWGGGKMERLCLEQIQEGERRAFFDRYLSEMTIVHYHNLMDELSAQALLTFHYLCAQTARLSAAPIETVRLTSDRQEYLRSLHELLREHSIPEMRGVFAPLAVRLAALTPTERPAALLGELRARFGVIAEVKGGHTLSINTQFTHELHRRDR